MSVLEAVKCQTRNYNILTITGSQHKAVWTLGVWMLCIPAQVGEAENKRELTPIKCLNVKKKGKKKSLFFLLSVSNYYNFISFVFCSPGKASKYVILTLIRKIPVKLLDTCIFFCFYIRKHALGNF